MGVCRGRMELRLGQPLYPSMVAELPDPPKTIYVRGDPTALNASCISIIGSRKATPYGLAVAEMAAHVAAESNLVVVSGGALGCDQAAGRAALEAGGRHVVVFGSGADVVYPRGAEDLVERTLSQAGAVISIEPWGAQPRNYTFPKRNRVIAALSKALFVTEAGLPSGTISTAETALGLGREVLSIPGSILSPESKGTNYLISEGATCITDEESLEVAISRIYGTLRYQRGAAPGLIGLNETESLVLDALIANPMRIDQVSAMLKKDVATTLKFLGGLSVRGLVETLFDGRFAPTKIALHARSRLGHNMGSMKT